MDHKCPSEDDLRRFAVGEMNDDDAQKVSHHLDECFGCGRTVDEFERSDSSVASEALRAAVRESFVHEKEFQAVRRLARSVAAVSAPTVDDLGEFAHPDLRLGELLGEGGMGTVHKAVHLRLGKTVAVKLVHARVAGESAVAARFRREMQVLGRLSHPNIVQAFDAGEVAGRLYLVMEFVDGLNLSQVLARHNALSIADACDVVRHAARGLQYAQDNGVVHRDVKPSNIMVARASDSSGVVSVKILDLGLARSLSSDTTVDSVSELTAAGQILGTIDYMAPEQGGAAGEADVRADVYSLGATLYKLLTGDAPYAEHARLPPIQRLSAIATSNPLDIRRRRDDVPHALAKLVHRMLAKRPEDRPSTPAEVAVALEPFSKGADLSKLLQAPDANKPRTATTDHARGSASVLTSWKPWIVGTLSALSLAIAGFLVSRTLPSPTTSAPDSTESPAESNEAVSDPTPTPPPEEPKSPFVVVGASGDLREHGEFQTAVDDLGADDVLEIRSRSRLATRLPTRLKGPLKIRAGEGFRPMLVVNGLPPEGLGEDVTIEGCDIDLRGAPPSSLSSGHVTFERCRLWGRFGAIVGRETKYSNCILVGADGVVVPAAETEPVQTTFENCAIRCWNTLFTASSGSHRLNFRNCTYYGHDFCAPTLLRLEDSSRVEVEARGCLFFCRSGSKSLVPPEALDQIAWRGDENYYAGDWFQVESQGPDGKPSLRRAFLGEWKERWTDTDQNSREIELIEFAWGQAQKGPNWTRPEFFERAVRQSLADWGAHSVAIDWSTIGTGDAYVRALRKDGIELSDSSLRPKPSPGGPFVLIRKSDYVGGFPTLQLAVDNAKDQDVVEIRTDAPTFGCRFHGDSRLITIRAAPGYDPVVKKGRFDDNGKGEFRSLGTDRLAIEGIRFEVPAFVSGSESHLDFGEKPYIFEGSGSIVRAKNCHFADGLKGWLTGVDTSPMVIENCCFGSFRCAIPDQSRVIARNSLFKFATANTGPAAPNPGVFAFERCVVFTPQIQLNHSEGAITARTATDFEATDSVFFVPRNLLKNFADHRTRWRGERNVYCKAGDFGFGDAGTLEDLRRSGSPETGSVELPPYEFGKVKWKIVREATPGYEPKADGTDYGVDVDLLP